MRFCGQCDSPIDRNPYRQPEQSDKEDVPCGYTCQFEEEANRRDEHGDHHRYGGEPHGTSDQLRFIIGSKGVGVHGVVYQGDSPGSLVLRLAFTIYEAALTSLRDLCFRCSDTFPPIAGRAEGHLLPPEPFHSRGQHGAGWVEGRAGDRSPHTVLVLMRTGLFLDWTPRSGWMTPGRMRGPAPTRAVRDSGSRSRILFVQG